MNIPDNTPKIQFDSYVNGKAIVRDKHASPYRRNSRNGFIFLIILFFTILIWLIISVFN